MPVTILPKKGRVGRPRVGAPKYRPPRNIHNPGIGKERDTVTFRRIMDLPEEQRLVLDTMFHQERGVPRIREHFQQVFKIWLDVTPANLDRFLYRYKKQVIDPYFAKTIVSVNQQRGVIPLINSKEDIDVLQEVGSLVIMQKERVQKMLNRERDMPMLFNTLKAEMQALGGFVQQFADLSFDMGLMKRAPKLTKITNGKGETTTIESTGKDEVQISIEQNQRLEAAAQSFFSIIDGTFTDVTDNRASS